MSLSDYSPVSRLMHRLALGNRMVAQTLADIDRALVAQRAMADQRAVFITGLPRAGSTFLLTLLAGGPDFTSLTYRDMPFVLMPALWHDLSRKFYKPAAPRERFHADGVAIGYDSPEAFEEVFWRLETSQEYRRADRLVPHAVTPAVRARFRHYVSNILRRAPGTRYISKNNNNILRLPALHAALPQSGILLLVRDPLRQAASMLAQHRQFSAAQRADRFFREYLRWLGHEEFGLDHRPCLFDGSFSPGDYNTDGIDYWLAYWQHVYGWLSTRLPPSATVVDYDALCADPARFADFLSNRLGVDPGRYRADIRYEAREAPAADPALMAQSYRIYDSFRQRHLI